MEGNKKIEAFIDRYGDVFDKYINNLTPLISINVSKKEINSIVNYQ